MHIIIGILCYLMCSLQNGGGPYLTLPYLTLPAGQMPARQTPSAEATARAQCASPTDLKVDRTSLKLGKPQEEKRMDVSQRIQ